MRFGLEVAEAPCAPSGRPTSRCSCASRPPTAAPAAGASRIRSSSPPSSRLGVDVIDCSSGGFDGYALKAAPLYQVPLAKALRQAGVKTMAVGLINEPADAERIVASGEADLVAFARGALEDPNWPLHAHHILDGGGDAYDLWPKQARNRIRDKDRVLGIRA